MAPGKIKLIRKPSAWTLYKNARKWREQWGPTSCRRWEQQTFLRDAKGIDRRCHPAEETPGSQSWWPLSQCAPVTRLISLASKFCYCHQGLGTFFGDGRLVLRKSSPSAHLVNTAENQEFSGVIHTYLHTHILRTYVFNDIFLSFFLFLMRPDCISEYFEAFTFGTYSPNMFWPHGSSSLPLQEEIELNSLKL